MKLEDFRHDPIGHTLFSLGNPNTRGSKAVYVSYIEYSLRAFYLTMQDLEELENAAKDIVPAGRNSIVAVSLWFLNLEAYINTLLKLTCLHLNLPFSDYKTKKISEKFTALLTMLGIDDIEIKKTGLHSRINEFSTFRNEIFHDRNTGENIQFSKTMFSPVPIQCNVVDVLQGLLIFLETASLLRYTIGGLDNMPDIMIHQDNKAFTRKLDILFIEVIKPSFDQILVKHKLTTALNLKMQFIQLPQSEMYTATDAAAYWVYDSPEPFKFQLNPEPTNICGSLFYKIVAGENIPPMHFSMGHYSLHKDQRTDENS